MIMIGVGMILSCSVLFKCLQNTDDEFPSDDWELHFSSKLYKSSTSSVVSGDESS